MIDYYFKKTIKENRPRGGVECSGQHSGGRGRMTTGVRKQLRNFFISNLAVAASHMHDGTAWRGVAGRACSPLRSRRRLWTSGVRFYDGRRRGRDRGSEKEKRESDLERYWGCIKKAPSYIDLHIYPSCPTGNLAPLQGLYRLCGAARLQSGSTPPPPSRFLSSERALISFRVNSGASSPSVA